MELRKLIQELVGTLHSYILTSVTFFCKSREQIIGKSKELMTPVLDTFKCLGYRRNNDL